MRLNLVWLLKDLNYPAFYFKTGKWGVSVSTNLLNSTLLQNIIQKPVILRKRRQRIKIEANWDLFYYR